MSKPTYEPLGGSGYTFNNINVIKKDRHEIGELDELCPDYNHHHLSVHEKNHEHIDRLIYEIASYIEGNLGPSYEATLFWSKKFNIIYIMTPKENNWSTCGWQHLSSFIMGLRSTLDLIKGTEETA